MPRLLLINPWIADVAAYDLWAWPLGLLRWAAWLRARGCDVRLIDCTDRSHPAVRAVGPRRPFGTGKYRSEPWPEQPAPARCAGREFRRFGLPPETFEAELAEAEAAWGVPPDAILVTSRMTYWYPGVADAVARCRRRWPDARRTPIVLGGVYATLCPEHARTRSGAGVVIEGNARRELPAWLDAYFPRHSWTPGRSGFARGCLPDADLPDGADIEVGRTRTSGTLALRQGGDEWPEPAFDLCHGHEALPVALSEGCPCDCSYCASRTLAPEYRRLSPEAVFTQVRAWHERWGTRDFAFYDDALLLGRSGAAGGVSDAGRFFDQVAESGLPLRFHAPNGLHYGPIDAALAARMRHGGLETVRLSLESASPERLAAWGRGGDNAVFLRAVAALREAGYSRRQIGVYILAGLPGHTADEVRRAIELARDAGAMPKLNEYSPIPGTREWPRALALGGPEIESEPLWQNNSLYRARPEAFAPKAFDALRSLALAAAGRE